MPAVAGNAQAEQAAATQALVALMPYNVNKPAHGFDAFEVHLGLQVVSSET